MKVLLFIIAFPISVWSQSDFRAWTGADIRIPVTQKFTTGLEAQSRFKSNLNEVEEVFVSPYVRYEIQKHIQLGVDYRLSNSDENGAFFGVRNTHRWTLDLRFRDLEKFIWDKTRFSINTRLRGTHAYSRTDENNSNIRFQLKVDYNLPKTKLTPFLSTEFFYHLNDQISYTFTDVETHSRFSKYRIRGGVNYPWSKRNSIKLFYIYEPEIQGPEKQFILGVGYRYRMKRLTK